MDSGDQNMNVYFWEQKRLESFADWPVSAPVIPTNLAGAGFYYTGQGDRVRCAFCGHVLGEWSPGDTPFGEHRRFYPQCPFLTNPFGCGNIVRGQVGSVNNVATLTSGRLSRQESQGSTLNDQSLQERPMHLQYSTYASRLHSFINYPDRKAQTPHQLAEAGFFYTGHADDVKCFFCDGGLKDWDPIDNPWTEHARWFPSCVFLKLDRGEQFVNDIQQMYQAQATGDQIIRTPNDQTSQIQIARQMGFDDNVIQRTVTSQLQKYGQPFNSPQDLIQAIQALGQMTIDTDTTVKTPYSPQVQSQSQATNPFRFNFGDTATKNIGGAIRTPNGEGMEFDLQPTTSEGATGGNTTTSKSKSTTSSETSGSDTTSKDSPSTSGNQNLKKTIEDLEEERTCKICMDEKANVVFLDCGHLICCENCATQVKKCPMCRQVIKKVVKTFMS